MSLQPRKIAIREFLCRRDWAAIRRWANAERNLLRTLVSCTFDSDEMVRLRAVEAIRLVAGNLAESDEDRVRDFIRRQLWLMNDASGALSRLAPEMIGETLMKVRRLADEFGPLLVSYLHETPFERGAHTAIARLSEVRPDLFLRAIPELHRSLWNPDPIIRGLAALTLRRIDPAGSAELIASSKDDHTPITLYDFDRGALVHTIVGWLADGFPEGACESGGKASVGTGKRL